MNNIINNNKEKYDIYYNFLILNKNIKFISLFKCDAENKDDVYKISTRFKKEDNEIINNIINDIKKDDEKRELYNLIELDNIYLFVYYLVKNNIFTKEKITQEIKHMFFSIMDFKKYGDLEIILQCRYINLINERIANFEELNYTYDKIIDSINKFVNYRIVVNKLINYILNNNIKFIINSNRINNNQLVIKNKKVVYYIFNSLNEQNIDYNIYNLVDISYKYINQSLNIIKYHNYNIDSNLFKEKCIESINFILLNNYNIKQDEIDELYVNFLFNEYMKRKLINKKE